MKKILVADYNDMRTLFKAVLTREGYEVEEAATGQELLQKTLDWQPDLIIMSFKPIVSAIDGEEYSKKLKTDPATQYIPIIMHVVNEIHLKKAKLLSLADGFIIRACFKTLKPPNA